MTTAAKVSVLLLYQRIFSLNIRWFRFLFYLALALVISNGVVLFVRALTQCVPRPLSSTWTHPGSCSTSTDATIMGAANAVIDLVILILPMRMTWTLQMKLKRKIGVCMIFGLGLVAVVVSVARAIFIGTTGFTSKGGDALGFITWSITEPAVGLICACLPITRPLYRAGAESFRLLLARLRNRRSGYSSQSDGDRKDHLLDTLTAPVSAKILRVQEIEQSWYRPDSDRGRSSSEEKRAAESRMPVPSPIIVDPRINPRYNMRALQVNPHSFHSNTPRKVSEQPGRHF